ncbi:unnamed protein product [Urochloa humidicola]
MLSSILVIGGLGIIGRHLVAASLDAGHPTAVLVRPATAANAEKAKLMEAFQSCGASLVYGDINEHEGLVAAIKQADVVISAVGHSSPEEVESQLKLVTAIQEAGGVKRFLPSEYGCDVELTECIALEPAKSVLGAKFRVREAIRAAGIPHTIICSNWFQGFLLPRAGNPEANGPPDSSVTIFGDGKQQVYIVNEKDMGAVAIKAVEDPRTLNRMLHLRPQENLCSLDQLVSLWENKIGNTLKKTYVHEEELVKKVQASSFPLNFQFAMMHATIVAGEAKVSKEATTTEISTDESVEATDLYPDMKYVTVEEYLDGLP